jgi:branched-chain amino acid transport system substrate-binding protein
MMRKFLVLVFVAVLTLSLLGTGNVQAEIKEYEIPAIADFSGPYADVMKQILPVRSAIITWWNDTEGKKLGVKLVTKNYDTRYDPSVTASVWPGIAAKHPIVGFGVGGADAAALQQRLPVDKIPIFYPTASYGYVWLPNQWIFHSLPTYAHEDIAVVNWYIKQHPEKRPVKIATMTSPSAPAYIDIVNGTKKYIRDKLEPQGLAKLVAEEWIDMQPVDITSQMKNLVEKKTDLVIGILNTTMAGAYIRAQQSLGVNIPTIASPFHTIWPLAMAMKSYEPWEGHYVVSAHFSSVMKEGKAFDFYRMLTQKYGLDPKFWNPIAELAYIQAILLVRAVEHAAEKVGGANLTGQAVYDTMFEKPFTEEELMGILPTLSFTKAAPFSTKDMKVMIATVKGGKYQLAAPGWVPVPNDLEKW